jgi:hypothetical protein
MAEPGRRVKTLKGEEELRHAKLLDFWEGP